MCLSHLISPKSMFSFLCKTRPLGNGEQLAGPISPCEVSWLCSCGTPHLLSREWGRWLLPSNSVIRQLFRYSFAWVSKQIRRWSVQTWLIQRRQLGSVSQFGSVHRLTNGIKAMEETALSQRSLSHFHPLPVVTGQAQRLQSPLPANSPPQLHFQYK